jgi:hypothetical protein
VWPYVLTAFVWTYFALGTNAAEKRDARSGFGWQTAEEAAVGQAAAVGLILGLALLVAAYNWPSVALIVPGAAAFIAWTIKAADWLVSFWLVRIILGFTVMGYVANFGIMILFGGVVLLYSLWNGARKAFAAAR